MADLTRPRNPRPFLWAIIGPNGAGKSTYYERTVRPVLKREFVNADRIARQQFPGHEEARSYDAARIAAERRQVLLDARSSFVMETVFSHPSKLAFLEEASGVGYEVWVTLLFLDSADLAVERVGARVRRGGHTVPEQKIRGRYERMRALAVPALRMADRAFVLDNSSASLPLRGVFQLDRGVVCERAGVLPRWAIALLAVLQ